MNKPAVFFDLGNVLVHLALSRGRQRFCTVAGIADSADLDLYLGAEAEALSSGALAPEAFFDAISKRLGLALPFAEASAAWCDIFDPWPEMETLASDVLDAGHPAYVLSNTDPLHVAVLMEKMPVLTRMTGLHLSYQIGVNKPDPRFFLIALERFGLAPTEACFVDDNAANVEAALALGIPSLVHAGDDAPVRAFLREQGVGV